MYVLFQNSPINWRCCDDEFLDLSIFWAIEIHILIQYTYFECSFISLFFVVLELPFLHSKENHIQHFFYDFQKAICSKTKIPYQGCSGLSMCRRSRACKRSLFPNDRSPQPRPWQASRWRATPRNSLSANKYRGLQRLRQTKWHEACTW